METDSIWMSHEDAKDGKFFCTSDTKFTHFIYGSLLLFNAYDYDNLCKLAEHYEYRRAILTHVAWMHA